MRPQYTLPALALPFIRSAHPARATHPGATQTRGPARAPRPGSGSPRGARPPPQTRPRPPQPPHRAGHARTAPTPTAAAPATRPPRPPLPAPLRCLAPGAPWRERVRGACKQRLQRSHPRRHVCRQHDVRLASGLTREERRGVLRAAAQRHAPCPSANGSNACALSRRGRSEGAAAAGRGGGSERESGPAWDETCPISTG